MKKIFLLFMLIMFFPIFVFASDYPTISVTTGKIDGTQFYTYGSYAWPIEMGNKFDQVFTDENQDKMIHVFCIDSVWEPPLASGFSSSLGSYKAGTKYTKTYLTDAHLVSYRNNGILVSNPTEYTYLGNSALEALKAIAYFYDYYKEFDLMDVVGYIIDHNQQTVYHMEPIAGRVYTSGHKYQDIPVEDRDNIKIYAFIAQETAPNGRRYQNVFGYELFAEITKNFELKVKKVDENGVPLKGVEFTIYNSNNEEVAILESDEDGIGQIKEQIKDFDYGEYTIKETKGIKGYNVDPTPKTIEILNQGEINYNNNDGAAIFTNPQKHVDLVITKTDLEKTEYVLGAYISVYKQNYNNEYELFDSWETTTDDHLLTLTDGKYKIVESTVTDTGYLYSSGKKYVIIKNELLFEVEDAEIIVNSDQVGLEKNVIDGYYGEENSGALINLYTPIIVDESEPEPEPEPEPQPQPEPEPETPEEPKEEEPDPKSSEEETPKENEKIDEKVKEDIKEENPKTVDYVLAIFAIMLVSLSIIIVRYFKKARKYETN